MCALISLHAIKTLTGIRLSKITQLGDFENQNENHCKTGILKIKIEIFTNCEFFNRNELEIK